MPASPGKLSSELAKEVFNQKLANMYIEPIPNKNAGDDDPRLKAEKPRAFQYWPDGINESQSANWAANEIPGASLPLYQFISLGERPISFTVYFSRDEDGEITGKGGGGGVSNWEKVKSAAKSFLGGGGIQQDKHNVDINAAIAWLRSLLYPAYKNNVYYPPRVLKLYVPNVKLSAADKEIIYCILVQVSINWMAFFPSGTPRLASVDLAFNEVAQVPEKGVKFYGRGHWRTIAESYTVAPIQKQKGLL